MKLRRARPYERKSYSNLDANKTALTEKVIDYYKKDYKVEIVKTEYEFQKGENKLLIIRK